MFAVPVAAVGAFGALAHHASEPQPVLADRRRHAGRAREQERDPAGRLRRPPRRAPGIDKVDGDRRSRARALPPDRHDDGLDDRRHDAARARARSGLGREALARHRRDRRFDELARPDARARSGRVRLARARSAEDSRPPRRAGATAKRRRCRRSRRTDVADATLRRAADARHRVPRAGAAGGHRWAARRSSSSSSRTPTCRRFKSWSAIPARRRPRCATRSCARSKISSPARPTSITSKPRSNPARPRSSRVFR